MVVVETRLIASLRGDRISFDVARNGGGLLLIRRGIPLHCRYTNPKSR